MTCITIKTYTKMKILMDMPLRYKINTQIYTLAFSTFLLWTFFYVQIDKQTNKQRFQQKSFYSHHVWSGSVPCESSEQFEALPDSSLTASSTQLSQNYTDGDFRPHQGRLYNQYQSFTSGPYKFTPGIWQPEFLNTAQYIQVFMCIVMTNISSADHR